MNTSTARKGRERTCIQCGAVYRSPRSTSSFCSAPCRKKASRGTAPTGGPHFGPKAWSLIGKLLHRANYVGPIAPTSSRDPSPITYGLTVEADFAHTELAALFEARGWGWLGRVEFDAAIRADGIAAYNTRTPEASDHKRWKDRQRQRMKRAA